MGFISHIDLEKNQWKMFGKVIDSEDDRSDLLSVTVKGLQRTPAALQRLTKLQLPNPVKKSL